MIPIYQDHTRLVEFADKKYQGRYCLSPFISITVDIDGYVSLCGCSAWQPSIVGNIMHNTLEEILSSDASTKIRKSIADGSYRYCNEKTCGIIGEDILIGWAVLAPDIKDLINDTTQFQIPREVTLALDATCNLSCPSCRTSVYQPFEGEQKFQQKIASKISSNIFSASSEQTVGIHLSTGGELFASQVLLEFVNQIPLDRYPNVWLDIQTNGLLAPSRWHRLGQMQNRVRHIIVTVDAATAPTYETLRRGGKWADIIESLGWISQRCQTNNIRLTIRMVVQTGNFKEIFQFYQMCQSFKADRIEYTRLADWGTYGDDFHYHDVFDAAHPLHADARYELSKVCDLPKTRISGGLPR